ncbi:MAG: cyclic nucleotide-binding domain-containing protein [Caldilineaceae bacterium]|nr:cyclic nucleotide-binding domain-containing protein [Caldilineaceae bacterium]
MDLLNMFRQSDDVVTFRAGETIFHAGDSGNQMYVVLDGEVEIALNNKVVETVVPGELLGELALVDQSPRSADAIARTDCRLVPINERRFLFLVQETPYFALQVMSVMANRLRRRTHDAVGS